MRGFFAAVLGLTLLQAVLSSNESAGRVGGIFGTASTLFEAALNPAVPAIPDLREGHDRHSAAGTDGKTAAGATTKPSSTETLATPGTPRLRIAQPA